MLFELEGGNHETGLNPNSGSGELGEKVVDWLNYHLLDNLDYCDTLLNIPSSASQFYTNLQCQEFFPGDVNGDYIINVQDIVLTVNLVLSGEYNSTADLNSDSVINVLDIVQIINIILN